ncbi:MAG: GtrA family protein [Prevotella sp.]|nr:GtrA family protein [Prevotella sp.]
MKQNTFSWLFGIRRDERWMALCVAIVLLALHSFVIYSYNNIFMDPGPGYWLRFLHFFNLSGYDPITYSVLTEWTAKYNVFRHPLLAFFVAPLYWINSALMMLTDVNCVQYVVAAVWTVFGVYAFLFSYRIQREIVGVSRLQAILLSMMLFGFGHVMVAAIAPDHFILSMTLLLLTIYLCGTLMKQHRELSIWQTIALFVFTAGITLSNGVKVFLCALFTNGRRFFRPKYLILGVILPAALIWTVARIEYRQLVLPMEKVKHEKLAKERKRKQELAKQKKMEAERTLQLLVADAAKAGDTATVTQLNHRLDSVKTAKPKKRRNPYGKPLAKQGFMKWTDISTSRCDAAVENLFGEGIQLHEDYVLGDVLRNRPVVVHYRYIWNYVVEGIIVLLFLLGIVAPFVFRKKMGVDISFPLMLLSCFAFDMLLHLGLGFGLNEVYIMSSHWIFIIPISIGYLFRVVQTLPLRGGDGRGLFYNRGLLALTAALTLFLWIWNTCLVIGFLII